MTAANVGPYMIPTEAPLAHRPMMPVITPPVADQSRLARAHQIVGNYSPPCGCMTRV
jgi:hypothetical protein